MSCDDAGCVVPMTGGRYVSLALRSEALADDCERAAVVVTARQAPANCAALVIDREQLQNRGTVTLRQTRTGFVTEAVRPKGVDRPWAPTAEAAAAPPDALTPRQGSTTRPRPADATPAEADQQSED